MLAHVSARRIVSWYVPAFGGAVSAAVLMAGLALALTGRFGESMNAPPPPGAATSAAPVGAAGSPGLRIVALGDSITAGTGDARAGGYPGRLADQLRARGREATVVNLAVPGAETADILRRVESEPVRAEIARADLILVSAGGNDLSHAVRPPPDRPVVDQDSAAASASANLAAMARRLRELNPTAPVRFIGLYNPFDVTASEEADARATLADWNDRIERATDRVHDVLVVPIADIFYDRPDRLARDHFHPGSTGHELIATRVAQTLQPSTP
jgi:lysophospholipase L1-like esterase